MPITGQNNKVNHLILLEFSGTEVLSKKGCSVMKVTHARK